MDDIPESIIRRLQTVCGLRQSTARQVVAEVLDEFSETVDEYVNRRHRALQRQGWANDEIYRRIRAELGRHRFASPPLSDRQIRRRIYG